MSLIRFDTYNNVVLLKELTDQKKNFVHANKMLNKREDRFNQKYFRVLGPGSRLTGRKPLVLRFGRVPRLPLEEQKIVL